MRSIVYCVAVCLVLCGADVARPDVTLPSIFGSHMVLQRNQPNRVWGWADPKESVTVDFAGKTYRTTADDSGAWQIQLEAMKAGGPYVLKVRGKNEQQFDDVLIGEVWICSGQSNMAFSVGRAYDGDLARYTADFPRIRLISVPQVGTQEPQRDFKGNWQVCSSESVGNFSAVGYFFGRELHRALDVPIGLIDNAWGGSAAEAWVDRPRLEADPRFKSLLERWDKTARTFDFEKANAAYKQRLAKWQEAARAARRAAKPVSRRPRPPRNPLTGQHRPANLYNGVLKPTIGYGIRGVIWYQGESNASRAAEYRYLFPLMIKAWREDWGEGDFPFYWVQLADFRAEVEQPADSAWAELREAQTMTMDKLPNTGQAVIIDVGEGRDIHPRNKLTVAKRLARWALAKDYGIDVVYRSPQYKSMKVEGNKIRVTFDTFGSKLYSFDTPQPRGFAVAGEDRKFYWAEAKLQGNDVIVTCPEVPHPVAVRYAWADNPVANLQNAEGLPVTPFRTDDWPGVTDGK